MLKLKFTLSIYRRINDKIELMKIEKKMCLFLCKVTFFYDCKLIDSCFMFPVVDH
jgi:hypothetical protein